MNEVKSGGCACGSVRYTARGPIEFSFNCHCRKCQRSTGGGHSSAFAVAKDEVTITGEICEYGQTSDSGAMTYSGFCPTCGSPILSKTDRFPERLYFHAATLDDPGEFNPQIVVFGEEAQPWDVVASSLAEAPR